MMSYKYRSMVVGLTQLIVSIIILLGLFAKHGLQATFMSVMVTCLVVAAVVIIFDGQGFIDL